MTVKDHKQSCTIKAKFHYAMQVADLVCHLVCFQVCNQVCDLDIVTNLALTRHILETVQDVDIATILSMQLCS